MSETELTSGEETGLKSAIKGLRQLAFGSVNDAVRLLTHLNDIDAGMLAELDLFMVSEIRRAKEGCLEIKFYDRLKAFEMLCAVSREREEQPAASSFYNALESAAKSACDADAV